MTGEAKIAIVTGGGRGIGQAISCRLAQTGCFVWVNYVSRPEAAQETVKLIEDQGGKGRIVQFDVADFNQVQAAFKEILAESGSLDILVNNAGITRDGLVARMKESDWDRVVDTNL
ncbi:MAG: SDR family NAD(P)-dependent oxidoreductase, partial [Desulfofustis sp.]